MKAQELMPGDLITFRDCQKDTSSLWKIPLYNRHKEMNPELLNRLTIDDIEKIVTVADILIAHYDYPSKKDYYTAVREKLKENAK